MSALTGRVALVTGVSRRVGIGFPVAERLGRMGASLFVQSWAPHDAAQPWGADLGGQDTVLAALREGSGALVHHVAADFVEPDAPQRVVDAAIAAYGHVDILVANHARSGQGRLGTLTAEELDAHLAVNVRATLLLVQAFAAQHDGRDGGRVVLLTSGQHLGPMPAEIDYAVSKGAVHQATATLAAALVRDKVLLNTVNPGPTDTGYADAADWDALAGHHPQGRWGQPDDAARLMAWLCTDDARWIVGQVIDSEGGFRL